MIYLLYKCDCCGEVHRGAESDLDLEAVIHGISEDWYDQKRLHKCEPSGRKFGIARLVGVEQLDS